MMEKQAFDLLTTVEQGGCSAKIAPQLLAKILKEISVHPGAAVPGNLLVGSETHDDAAVWKIDEETAMIQTTDFFPPLCSDAYEFGQIAAANAMSDVYAMGGRVILALNLVMFPAQKIDVSVLKEILKGGAEKVTEAGGVLAGGHSIDDFPPKYGLAVTGLVHPDRVITNSGAKEGDVLVLTKPLGAGTVIAGQRLGEVSHRHYRETLEGMKQLNREGAELMQKYNICCATDITGFSLLGHALEMARASAVTITINAGRVPLLNGAYQLIDLGCIPGAAFRNLNYVDAHTLFSKSLDYNLKMLLLDAQTSGGLLISCPQAKAGQLVTDLKAGGYPHSAIVGSVNKREEASRPYIIVK